MNKKTVGMLFCILIFTFSSVIGTQMNDIPKGDVSSWKSEIAGGNLQLPNSSSDSTPTTPVLSTFLYSEDIIVYTAHQDWPSRIYLLRMDGSVITYYQYDFYRLVDLEVVNNEVYVAEAFAPRVYKINLDTGDLELVIDDWSLYYFYDLAFDGTYFYVTEWDLNRYDINGNKNGTASFDEDVMGATWDGTYYWTLNDENQIKCWDISGWPTITEIPDNAFAPPTPNCRGLWFDGRYFWTAESIEGTLGYIYKFNYSGEVINQWLEPAFQGWAACVITGNGPPQTPDTPSGPIQGEPETEYAFSSSTADPEGDSIYYLFNWGDGTDSDWLGPYGSGDTCTTSNTWINPGAYYVKVKARDIHDNESDWSDSLSIAIYTCGDCTGDGAIDIADVVYLINYLFSGGAAPDPIQAGDVNLDMAVDIADVVYLINYLFAGGPPPGSE